MTRAATFLGLMLLCPCPWFALAVGGLLPLPVIVAYGTAGGVMLAISLIHLVVYTWIFHKIAWSIGSFVRHRHISQTFAAAVVAAIFVAIGFAPIYGSGENLAAGNKLKHTAWDVYRSTFPSLRHFSNQYSPSVLTPLSPVLKSVVPAPRSVPRIVVNLPVPPVSVVTVV